LKEKYKQKKVFKEENMHIVFDMAYDQKVAPSGVQAG